MKVLLVPMVLAVAMAAAGFGYLLSLPSVANAQSLVQRGLAEHDAESSGPTPPAKLGAAVVAVEDEHFYSNFAVNILDGAGRAAIATLHASGDPGGSTIAQQLAKQLYGHGSGFGETIQEIGLSVKLSLAFSKPQILDMYLNAVYYGNGYWGDESAAEGYFGKSPQSLDWAQAAMLAGLPQAPSDYDPFVHWDLAKQRQAHVLQQLVRNRYLTQPEANAAAREPLGLRHG